ncbi:MAG: hypothetical protein LBI53_05055 [Candidatus Peribacteria bacterium]|jgi:hypothetical protein|nr:hypothetical protein [Candidatus Peribacteria bacterium]
MKANDVERIAEDKVLGNQTRRSLEGLKTWIESEHILTYDKIEEYKERDILKMKFVSKDFLVILKEKNKQLFDKFWEEKDEKFTPINGYNFTQAWSNNYVVKKE